MELASFQEVSDANGIESLDSVGSRGADIASANELAAAKVADLPQVMAVASRIEFPVPASGEIARYFATPDSGELPQPTYDENGCASYSSEMSVFERRERPDDGGNTVVSFVKVGGFELQFVARSDGALDIILDEVRSDSPHELARDSPFGVGEQGKVTFQSWMKELVQRLETDFRGSTSPIGRALASAADERRHDLAMMAPNATMLTVDPQPGKPALVGLQWASEVNV